MSNSSKLSSDILISIATVPVLALLLSGKAIAELVQQVGEASEELFRGDRLPTLHFSSAPGSNPTDELE